MKIGEFETHGAADAWPLMDEAELMALVASVKEHGLREPVKLYEGQILDGRNRAIACERAGVGLRTEMLPADVDPWEYSATINGRRRHIADPARRTAIVLSLLEDSGAWKKMRAEAEGRLDKSREAAGSTPAPKTPTIPRERPGTLGKVAGKVAEAAGVSTSTAERVIAVWKKDPEAFDRLKRDGGSAKAAAKTARQKERPPLVSPEPAIADEIGREVPPQMRKAWHRMQITADSFGRAFSDMQRQWTLAKRDLQADVDAEKSPLLARFIKRVDHVMTEPNGLKAAAFAIRSEAPFAVCWKCDGEGCQHCDKTGAYVASSKAAVERALGKK